MSCLPHQQNTATNFDNLDVKNSPKEVQGFIEDIIIKANVFIIQGFDSIICGYFCIGFSDFMLNDKSLIDVIIFFTK